MQADAIVILHDDAEVTLTYRFNAGVPDGWYISRDGIEFHYNEFQMVLEHIKSIPNLDDICKIPKRIAASIGWQGLQPPTATVDNHVSMSEIDEVEMIRVANRLHILKENVQTLVSKFAE